MRVETIRKIILTKEERKTISDLYKILDEDNSIDACAVWDILTDIYMGYDSVAKQYGYNIEIVD